MQSLELVYARVTGTGNGWLGLFQSKKNDWHSDQHESHSRERRILGPRV